MTRSFGDEVASRVGVIAERVMQAGEQALLYLLGNAQACICHCERQKVSLFIVWKL